MHILRTSSMLVRLVLAWFVLTLGAASAAPMVQPVSMALVCADGGVKVVLVDRDGAAVHPRGHTLDCPLCLPATAPPPLATPCVVPPQLAAAVVRVPAVFHVAATAGAPLPPRGPPAHS